MVHTEIKACELSAGDVIRIGASENYILAYEVTRTGRQISVWAADGSEKAQYGPSLQFKATAKVNVSRRGYLPWVA